MRAVLEPERPPPLDNPSVATVGVFDGVHLGHAAILRETVGWAREAGCASAVVTFRRHPDALLKGEAPPALTSLEHRLRLLERAGVDLALVLNFDEQVRSTTAEEFCRDWLAGKLRARGVVLGPDNAFGRDREGTFEKVRAIGRRLGFETRRVAPALVNGKPVSSTAIRRALARGDLSEARAMLGRDPSLYGTVVHGAHRGASLGFPTANLNLRHEMAPARGVYAGRALVEEKTVPCVVNVGRRPTFGKGEPEDTVEIHLLDFEGDLYGKGIELSLVERLRDEKAFPGPEALAAQIRKDVERARDLLGA